MLLKRCGSEQPNASQINPTTVEGIASVVAMVELIQARIKQIQAIQMSPKNKAKTIHIVLSTRSFVFKSTVVNQISPVIGRVMI